jgi:hypothetical protein
MTSELVRVRKGRTAFSRLSSKVQLSEWRLVGCFRLRRNRSVSPAADQPELLSYDFGSVTKAGSVLGLVLASGQSAFNVNLAPLGKQTLAVVRELSEATTRCHSVRSWGSPLRSLNRAVVASEKLATL